DEVALFELEDVRVVDVEHTLAVGFFKAEAAYVGDAVAGSADESVVVHDAEAEVVAILRIDAAYGIHVAPHQGVELGVVLVAAGVDQHLVGLAAELLAQRDLNRVVVPADGEGDVAVGAGHGQKAQLFVIRGFGGLQLAPAADHADRGRGRRGVGVGTGLRGVRPGDIFAGGQQAEDFHRPAVRGAAGVRAHLAGPVGRI